MAMFCAAESLPGRLPARCSSYRLATYPCVVSESWSPRRGSAVVVRLIVRPMRGVLKQQIFGPRKTPTPGARRNASIHASVACGARFSEIRERTDHEGIERQQRRHGRQPPAGFVSAYAVETELFPGRQQTAGLHASGTPVTLAYGWLDAPLSGAGRGRPGRSACRTNQRGLWCHRMKLSSTSFRACLTRPRICPAGIASPSIGRRRSGRKP